MASTTEKILGNLLPLKHHVGNQRKVVNINPKSYCQRPYKIKSLESRYKTKSQKHTLRLTKRKITLNKRLKEAAISI